MRLFCDQKRGDTAAAGHATTPKYTHTLSGCVVVVAFKHINTIICILFETFARMLVPSPKTKRPIESFTIKQLIEIYKYEVLVFVIQ